MTSLGKTTGADSPNNLDKKSPYFRAVRDLVRQEVGRLRGGSLMDMLSPRTRLDTVDDGGGALGLKSINLIDVATVVSDMFNIGAAGLDELLLARRTLGDWAQVAEMALSVNAEKGEAAISFRTSGTAGAPKAVSHPLWRFQEEVDFWAAAFSDRKRIIAAVPAHHVYGFIFTCLLADRLGIDVMDCRYMLPGALVTGLEAGDLLVAHPDTWQRVSATIASQGLTPPRNIHGVSSTAPLSEGCAHGLMGQGFERMLEVYGSTETLAIGWRTLPADSFSLLPLWEREMDAVVHRLHRFKTPLQDRLEWTGEQTFTVGGRLDGVIQVGGTNVSLEALQHAALSISGVHGCTAWGKMTEHGVRLVVTVHTSSMVNIETVRQNLSAAMAAILGNTCEPELRIISNKG